MRPQDLIVVKAKITMKATEEGGKHSGITSGYRPNHVFELPQDLNNICAYIGDIQLGNQELINPGETKIATVRFLKMPKVEEYIKVGQKWIINEGRRTVGFGEIISISTDFSSHSEYTS